MKNLYSLVIVALMVAPVTVLRADNLEDDSSAVKAKLINGGKFAVDAGIMTLLNKYANSSVAADKAAIVKMTERLKTARNDVKYHELENWETYEALERSGGSTTNWSNFNNMNRQKGNVVRQLHDLKAERDGLLKFIGKKGNSSRTTMVRANEKLAAIETEIKSLSATEAQLTKSLDTILSSAAPAEAKVAKLLAIRDEAVQLISQLPEDITKVQRASNGMRVFQILGNIGIGLDMLGHGWAFYDNSSTPLFMGGYAKLAQESHDAIYGKIKNHVVQPDPKAEERARIEKLPTRGSLVPQGPTTHGETPAEAVPANVTTPSTTRPEAAPATEPAKQPEVIEEPFNRLPPFLKKKPELRKAPKMAPAPKPMS